jgi:hypothetical protein
MVTWEVPNRFASPLDRDTPVGKQQFADPAAALLDQQYAFDHQAAPLQSLTK